MKRAMRTIHTHEDVYLAKRSSRTPLIINKTVSNSHE